MVDFIDNNRAEYGVEPICDVVQIAPSTYFRHCQCRRDPSLRANRAKRDDWLSAHIVRVWRDNFSVYGAEKVWRQLNRENIPVARCTVERLMNKLGLAGAVRGGKKVFTTISDAGQERAPDLVERQFTADRPNQLWVADFTYVSTWSGFVYVAFVIDVFARYIVGWRVSRTMKTDLVLDALEQALWARQPEGNIVHHSDRGSQYLSIRYTERLAEAGIDASVGTTGDSYDNALAESIIGLYKTEIIRQRGPWKGIDAVEYSTLSWVDWFNKRRILKPVGNIPPAEKEQLYYDQQTETDLAA